ncbi:LysR family transcriptional regulator [Paucibacter sp. APW11]|uniref:LysR family transcriptional regulator n=1 Tax=Roseateles aquae TaxID=3077235 RepID=A0ABU3P9F4_9BURK|nr:LysR family transcriptional regulator [Paucibacter sp. APW11]MDT8998850.1 LysR family transcriptional regulator [Paucibacter sp. APW11]
MTPTQSLLNAGAERAPELLHFRAFEAIYRLGSLTAAAEDLGLSQPALSKSLATLRRYYDDELFSRNKTGMRPTHLAHRLAPAVAQVIQVVDRELRQQPSFVPQRSSRVFRVSCSDVGAVHFVPKLMAEAAQRAPGLRWDIVPLTGASLEARLASGDVDLCLGVFTDPGPRVLAEPLYGSRYVCLVREGHPRIKGQSMTLAQFCRERHVVASLHDSMHSYQRVEQAVLAAAGEAAIGARVHSVLVAPYLVAQTDFVFTATEQVSQRLARAHGLRVVDCPLDLPSILVHQYWHSRFNDDPAVCWLRRLNVELFASV